MTEPSRRATPLMVLIITTAGAFVSSFSASSVNVALPLIGLEYHLAAVTLNWVVTAFVLTSAVLIMPMGRLGDLHGRQRVFSWGLGVMTLGSLSAALAPTPELLLAARALSGVGMAMATGTITAVLVAAYPPEQRGRILGINVAMVYLGISVGPALGGVLTQLWGWRALFGLHAALSLTVLGLVVGWLHGNDKQHQPGKFDLVGSLVYAGGLALLLVGVSDLPQLLGIGLLVAGFALLAVFWWYESKTAHPVLPVTLLTKNRIFAFSNLAAVFSYSATFSVAFFLSLYLEVVRGFSPAQTGLVLVTQSLVQAAFSPLTGRLSDKLSPRWLASGGMALTALGLVGLAFLDAVTPLPFLVGALVLIGLGFALFSSPNTNAVMGSVERRDLGLASATVATMRVVGQMASMGLALVLLSLILGKAAISAETSGAFVVAQRWGFGLSALLCTLGIAASLARGSRKAEEPGQA
ncbi:MAG: MFS transporter [Spirochaetales bacterium]